MNFVPISVLSMFGTIAVFDVAPAAATISCRSRACAIVFTGLVCHVAQTFSSLPMLPSQLNFSASKCAPGLPNSGSIAAPLVKAPITEPSRAALVNSVEAAAKPAADGMSLAMISG